MRYLEIISSSIVDGLSIIKTKPFFDHRGKFSRFFCEKELAVILGDRHIVQINFSKTKYVGTIRGLHFQHAPFEEMKLIRCLKGKVWDVAVDLRKESPSYLKWHAEELTPGNAIMIVIPEGCAHGFQVLEKESELMYLHTAPYKRSSEDGVRYNDPVLNIQWPLEVTEISERDKNHNLLNNKLNKY